MDSNEKFQKNSRVTIIFPFFTDSFILTKKAKDIYIEKYNQQINKKASKKKEESFFRESVQVKYNQSDDFTKKKKIIKNFDKENFSK